MIARLMGLKTISPVHLHQLIQDGGATIVDVNSRDSWTTARVPGAQHLDHASYTERDLPEDRGAALVFYCSGPLCRKAPLAARRAEKLGYRDVRVLSAGISGWLSANLPTEHGERSTA